MSIIDCRKSIARQALKARPIRTDFTVSKVTVRSTGCKIRWENVSFMTLATISINDVIASINWRNLTIAIGLIYRIAINTITAILVVIKAFCTVCNEALFTTLHSSKWFMVHIPSTLTFKACIFFYTRIAISHWTVTTLWSCRMNLLANTTVFNRIPRNISISIDSPISAPFIFYNPVFFCISNQ